MRMLLILTLASIGFSDGLGGGGLLDQGPTVRVRTAKGGSALVAVVTDRQSGTSTEVVLHPALIRASDVKVGSDRTVVIGESSDGVIVTVIDRAGKVTGTVAAHIAATSPDGRLVAYQHYIGRHERNPRAAYAVYDTLTGAGAPQAPGQPRFFPADGAIHRSQSDLFWVSDRVLAFLDYAEREVALVGAELSENGSVLRVVRKPLDTSLLLRSDREVYLSDPALAISRAEIRKKPGNGMQVRLSFNNPALAYDRVDITLW